jgi:PmbA protein
MSQELLKTARAAVRAAQKRGAQGVRANVSRNRDSRVEWRDGKLDRVRENTTMGLALTLYVDGRYSSHSTSDLRPEALERFMDETVAMTRLLAADPHRKLPDPERYRNIYRGDLKLYDAKGSAEVTGATRRRTASALEEAARTAPGADRIISVAARCSDQQQENALVTSNGMADSERYTAFVLVADVTVRDEDHRKPRGFWYSVTLQRDQLDSIESVGAEATRRAIVDIGGRPLKSGTYPCVVANWTGERLLQNLGEPLGGNSLSQKRSFLAGKIGEQILSPLFTVTDDPHVVGGLGSSIYDGEGMATRKMPIFEEGVLCNYFLDTYYASKLDMEPTTAAPSNIVFTLGNRDMDGLLKAMGSGILITDFRGGNANPATGDFSIGIRGQWVENGEVVHPVAEMNIAGNQLEFWKHVVEMGSDPFRYSSTRCPSMRFDGIQFSGV